MQLLLFSSSFHFTLATLFPSFATFTLHRPPLSHASPLLCKNLFRSHPIKSTLYWFARVKNSSNTWVATSGDLATTLFKWALPKVTSRTPQSWGAFNLKWTKVGVRIQRPWASVRRCSWIISPPSRNWSPINTQAVMSSLLGRNTLQPCRSSCW